MNIKKVKIQNYRSIVKLEININEKNNFVCFCGPNNVGKTNILNAMNLFFGNDKYSPEKDCPNHKFYGTRGGHYQPKIEITFKKDKDVIKITKDWNLNTYIRESEGNDFKISGRKNKAILKEKECNDFIRKIYFFYLPSINISFPDVIKYIMNSDIIDIETDKARMSGKKGEMKVAIERVLRDLKSILDLLGENISPLLEKYKEGWGMGFDLPTEVNTFRDLMIREACPYIKDKSDSKAIDAKGSGLQRLCHILIYFRIVGILNKKKLNAILCIDEPDVYLHSGLQKKLLDDIKEKSLHNQIFITTHSAIFIDTIKLSNVFLLEQRIEPKEYKRAKRKTGGKLFNSVETQLVKFDNTTGISTLKNYLGIEDKDNLFFDKYNIIVEGEEDKIYISKLMNHFGIAVPNIIPCAGADNIPKYLDFYESISEPELKNQFLVIFDNDVKGREVDKIIKSEKYTNIRVEKKFIISYDGYKGDSRSNIEIEDFIKPQIICYLVNQVLNKIKLNEFKGKDIKEISQNIKLPAFQNRGILDLLEHKKNILNPENGSIISIDSKNDKKKGVKWGMATIFDNLDKNIIELIGGIENEENKNIVQFLKEISCPREV